MNKWGMEIMSNQIDSKNSINMFVNTKVWTTVVLYKNINVFE